MSFPYSKAALLPLYLLCCCCQIFYIFICYRPNNKIYIYISYIYTHIHTHKHTQLLLKLVKRSKENKHLCCLSSLLDIYWCYLSFHVDFSYILRTFALSLKNFFPYFLASGSLSSNSLRFCLPRNLYIMSSLLKDSFFKSIIYFCYLTVPGLSCGMQTFSCSMWDLVCCCF